MTERDYIAFKILQYLKFLQLKLKVHANNSKVILFSSYIVHLC